MQTEFLMKHLEEVISSSTSCGHCFIVQFFRKTKLHETRDHWCSNCGVRTTDGTLWRNLRNVTCHGEWR